MMTFYGKQLILFALTVVPQFFVRQMVMQLYALYLPAGVCQTVVILTMVLFTLLMLRGLYSF